MRRDKNALRERLKIKFANTQFLADKLDYETRISPEEFLDQDFNYHREYRICEALACKIMRRNFLAETS